MRRLSWLGCCALAIVLVTAAPAGAVLGVTTSPAVHATHHHWRQLVGAVLGGAVLVGALLFWSFGHGLLGGRIRTLSRRLPPAEGPGSGRTG